MWVATGAARNVRNILVGLVCFLGSSACGFFADEAGNPPSKRTSTQPPSSAVQNYPAFTAGQWLNLSRNLYQESKYLESIGAAQTALRVKPDYAEAYNNIGAAYAALRLWDPAIQADQQAIQLEPGMQLARNNLAWAVRQKALEQH
jgi:tetratricopeptide (TPR) repeat protein